MASWLISKTVVIACLLWLASVTTMHVVPATYWMEIHNVQVAPALHMREPVNIHVLREVKRPFTARWDTDVHRWNDELQIFASYCTGTGRNAFQPPSTSLPVKLDLRVWTGNACPALPAGRYVVYSHWTIEPGGMWPTKHLHNVSNVFEVVPE